MFAVGIMTFPDPHKGLLVCLCDPDAVGIVMTFPDPDKGLLVCLL